MKRTPLYLDPDLELRLKQETRRQKRPMADIVRDAIRQYVGDAPATQPPGAGAFASKRGDTGGRAEDALKTTRFGEDG